MTTLAANFTQLLAHLMRFPAVVGAERSFFRVIERELEQRNVSVSLHEGVLVAQGSQPESAYLSAHMDRHGLICTGPDVYRYAAFVSGRRSDLLGNAVSEAFMQKIVTRFQGETVYAYEPWSGAYHGRGVISDAKICERRHKLIFSVDGLVGVEAGMPLAFEDQLQETDRHLAGQIDNVISVAALIYLFEQGFQGTAFFTAQEESGSSWRYLLDWFRQQNLSTNRLLVIDTTPFPDAEAAAAQDLVLRHEDANGQFDPSYTTEVAKTLEELNYSFVYKDDYVRQLNQDREAQGKKPMGLGNTELGRIVSASEGQVKGTTLQLPTFGYHTLSETATKSSVQAYLNALMLLSGLPHQG